MKLLKNLIVGLAVLVTSIFLVASPQYAHAELFTNSKNQACAGASLNDGTCDPTASNAKVSGTLAAVINILSLVLGVISVIMIIIAGIRFTTSQGDGNATAGARNTIIYAIVGIVIAVMAQFIVKFVLGRTA